METVWILGVGRFGRFAMEGLSKQHKDWQFVLVDTVAENLTKAEGPHIAIEQADGIRFLNDQLTKDAQVSWVIPCLPLHLAFEWARLKIGPDRLVQTRLPSGIESVLPNSMQGVDKNIYVSNADFMCPATCSEPEGMCTVTKQPRKKDMFRQLEAIRHESCFPIVLRSRQLGPGIGGYSPVQLFSFLREIEQRKGLLLLCTACRCHGVVTAVDRLMG